MTTVEEGQSFEGLSVHLQCEGSYTPFPLSVKCRRHPGGTLQWTNLPVCFPTILVTAEHWSKVPHALRDDDQYIYGLPNLSERDAL